MCSSDLNGLKTVFEDQLTDTSKGDEILIISPFPVAYDILPFYFKWFDKRRQEKRIKARIIKAPRKDLGSFRTGKPAPKCAINAKAAASGPIKVKRIGAVIGISAATKPRTVIGATNGDAARLAGILTSDNVPDIAIITGVHIIVAAIGIASGSGKGNLGAIRIIPAVAPTERAKPGSIA